MEGKNHHIKRVCEHIGHPVIKLQRTHFAGLGLTGLPLGACRFLSTKEIKSLKKLILNNPQAIKPKWKKEIMIITLWKYFPPLLMGFWFCIAGVFFNIEAFAQQNMGDVYEGIATVQVERRKLCNRTRKKL